MEISARFVGGSKFEVAVRGHHLISDQPGDNGGEDAGMSPPELLLASLATCAGYYAAQYLETRGLNCENLQVKVSATKAQQPARFSTFRIDIDAPLLDERHQAALSRAVKSCLIHNTLLSVPAIEVAIHSGSPVNA